MIQPSFLRQLHRMMYGFGVHTSGCLTLTMISMSSSDLFLQGLLPVTIHLATTWVTTLPMASIPYGPHL